MIYVGIDEAGYGPLVGPLVIGRTVFRLDDVDGWAIADETLDESLCLWGRLRSAVCRTLAEQRKTRRLAINDSKKLHTKASGLRHLASGCLAFAGLCDEGLINEQSMDHTDAWLQAVGADRDDLRGSLWWYAKSVEDEQAHSIAQPVESLSLTCNMLRHACKQSQTWPAVAPGAAVVWEDRYNQMVRATRSKAAVNFHHVAGHLAYVAEHFGQMCPFVAIDRQGGRTHYREPLAWQFPDWKMTVLREDAQCSVYRLEQGDRAMIVVFQVGAEQHHLPVALASMTAKYTRELLMHRFNAAFAKQIPGIKPTAGYGVDGRRFVDELTPHLQRLNIPLDWVVRER